MSNSVRTIAPFVRCHRIRAAESFHARGNVTVQAFAKRFAYHSMHAGARTAGAANLQRKHQISRLRVQLFPKTMRLTVADWVFLFQKIEKRDRTDQRQVLLESGPIIIARLSMLRGIVLPQIVIDLTPPGTLYRNRSGRVWPWCFALRRRAIARRQR